jgi:hypothetical protein
MNLDQIRVFVRTQLDLDETDLPDILLDVFIRDGYDHIVNLERRWPFFEVIWLLTADVDGTVILPLEADVVESVIAQDGHRLWHADTRWIEDNFAGSTTTGTPAYWSQINRTMYIWPKPTAVFPLQARGFRKPADWVAAGASAEVDADVRLHIPVAYYACSMGYAQQEDEVLEQTYMNRFREAVTVAQAAVMRAWTGQPKILNGTHYAHSARGGAPSLVFQLPDGTVVP